jgi:hypothetical protein
MTQIMMARYAPTPSSPAQVRAAGRLRGSDGATRPSQKRPPFHQSTLANLTIGEERLHCFGWVVTPAFPSEVPTPGRWIRAGHKLGRGTRSRAP